MDLVECSLIRKCKRKSKSNFGSTLDDLPDALLTEILHRLPLKSAKQCTSVCKRWYTLMSDPCFAQLFLERNFFPTLLFSCQIGAEEINHLLWTPSESIFRSPTFSLSYLPCSTPNSAFVLASFQDLLLCCKKFSCERVLYICNPLTGQWIQLPPCPLYPWRSRVGFVCEGGGSNFSYTVVRIPSILGRFSCTELKVQIFSSHIGSWVEKMVPSPPRTFEIPTGDTGGLAYKGLLFWFSRLYGLVGLDPCTGECLRFIDPPKEFESNHFERLGVCNGILRLFQLEYLPTADSLLIRVWDLKNYETGEWCLEYQISFGGFRPKEEESYAPPIFPRWLEEKKYDPYFHPLTCDPNHADTVYIKIDESKIVSCNLRTQRRHDIFDITDITLDPVHSFGEAFTYVLPWLPTRLPSVPLPQV